MSHRSRAHGPVMAVALTAAFLVPAPTSAAAQSGDASIVGQITSQLTDEPVSGAAVVLLGTEHEAVTTEDGIFAMEELPAGDHELVVRYMDMESRVFPVRLERRQPLTVDFTVDMQVIPVASLEVTVEQTPPRGKLHDFYRRAANGPGYFITREDIEARPISRPTDILRRVPGLDIGARRSGRTPVTMGRRDGCVPDFYLDGARAPYFNIDDLEPMDIAGIEIYRGNSEVPIRFKHRDRCGVIVIWTRDPSNVRSFD